MRPKARSSRFGGLSGADEGVVQGDARPRRHARSSGPRWARTRRASRWRPRCGSSDPAARTATTRSGRTGPASAVPAAAATCIRPESLPTNSAARSMAAAEARMSPLPTKSMPAVPAASSAGVAGGRSPGPPTGMKRQPSKRGSAFSLSTSSPQRSAGQLLPGWWAMGARAMIGPGAAGQLRDRSRRRPRRGPGRRGRFRAPAASARPSGATPSRPCAGRSPSERL